MYQQKTVHNLTFTTFRDPTLPDFIRDIVEVRGHDVETTKRLYPRNSPEILINLAEPIRGKVGSKTAVIEQCTIQGSKTEYVNAWHPRNCHFISIRFTPNGYYKILDESLMSFTDHVFDLDDVTDYKIEELVPVLRSAPSAIERFRILIKWLNREVCKREEPSELLSDFIIGQLNQNPNLSVRELVDKIGYTRKHLAHRFKEEVGLTIKEYQKIYRIYRVLKYLNATEEISWAQIACQFGFYDQSHFIKDFKQYTGITPTDYLRRNKSGNSLSH